MDPPAGLTHVAPALRYPPPDAEWLNHELTQIARRGRAEWGYNIIVYRRDQGTQFFASRSMPTQWGDTIVYAVEYPRTSIDSLLQSVLASSDLLPPSLVAGRPNDALINLEVSSVRGRPMYSTPGAIGARCGAYHRHRCRGGRADRSRSAGDFARR